MARFLLLLGLLGAAGQDRLAPLLERWRSAKEEDRLQVLRDAASLRRDLGDAALAVFAAAPVPQTWARPSELLDLVSRERISSWFGLIVPLLASPDAETRARAAEELGRRELGRYSARVAPLLKDPDSRVAWQAAFSLVQMDARDRVPELVPMLKDPESSVRQNVLHALGRLGSSDHGALLAPLLDDEDPAVRFAAVRALGELGADAYAGQVARFLDEPDPVRRQAVIAALAGMNAKDRADEIAKHLSDAELLVRWEAIRALGRLGAREHAGAIVSMAGEDGAQAPVLEAMGALGMRELAPHIIPFLENVEPGIRWRAVRALGSVDARDDAKRVAGMLKDDDSFVRLTALEALSALGAAAQTGEMLARLQDEDPDVSQAAAEETALLLAPLQVPEVAGLLGAGDSFLRWSALRLLVAAEARGALPAIQARLQGPGQEDWNLLWALGRLGGPGERSRLVAGLRSRDAFVRQQAAFALARVSERAEELEAAERSDQGAPKLAAAVALLRLGRKDRASQLGILAQVLERREDPEYRSFAEELVDALEAAHEKELTAWLSRKVKAQKRIQTLRDLQDLLSGAGLTISPEAPRELRRRMPAGTSSSARRVLEWSFGGGLRPVAAGSGRVAMLDLDRALQSWQKRLDAR